MAQNNSDWPAVHRNIKKASQKWAMIACPLWRTGVKPKIVGMFYKAIVQAVLLYACETWVVTPRLLKALAAFHNRIARKIANMMPRKMEDDTWYYPPLEKALKKAGLHPIEVYIQ